MQSRGGSRIEEGQKITPRDRAGRIYRRDKRPSGWTHTNRGGKVEQEDTGRDQERSRVGGHWKAGAASSAPPARLAARRDRQQAILQAPRERVSA